MPVDIEAVLINAAVTIAVFFLGSYIYTKMVMRCLVANEVKKIIREVSEELRKDGELKEKVSGIVESVIDVAIKKLREVLMKYRVDVPDYMLALTERSPSPQDPPQSRDHQAGQ